MKTPPDPDLQWDAASRPVPNRVLERLQTILSDGKSLSPKYKALSDYIMRHPEEVAFNTAAEVARNSGVSEATVIRFATWLSYSGYPEFQDEFKAMLRDELSTVRRLRQSLDQARPHSADPLTAVLEHEFRNLTATRQRIDMGAFNETVDLILGAPVIYSVGLRASTCLASSFAYQAREISPRVVTIAQGGTDALEQLEPVDGGILVAFAFPRYPRETIELVDHARTQNLHVVGVTDSFSSPLSERSDTRLLVPIDGASFVDLYAAPLSVAAALVYAASHADEERALHQLRRFESFSESVGLFWPSR